MLNGLSDFRPVKTERYYLYIVIYEISTLCLKKAKFLQPKPNCIRIVLIRIKKYPKENFTLICIQCLFLIDVAFLPCLY